MCAITQRWGMVVVVKKKKEREGEEAHVTTHVSYVRVGVYVERMYMVYTVWWWLRWRFVYSNVSRGVHVLVRESIYASCVRGPQQHIFNFIHVMCLLLPYVPFQIHIN